MRKAFSPSPTAGAQAGQHQEAAWPRFGMISLSRPALCRHTSKIRASCGNAARGDPYGALQATAAPAATQPSGDSSGPGMIDPNAKFQYGRPRRTLAPSRGTIWRARFRRERIDEPSEREFDEKLEPSHSFYRGIHYWRHSPGGSGADPAKKAEALKFVIHFVGGMHQPLHCEDDGDKGGNTRHVIFDGKPDNLHWVWDPGLLEHIDRNPEALACGVREAHHGYGIAPSGPRAASRTGSWRGTGWRRRLLTWTWARATP
jgi:hypothetical protein